MARLSLSAASSIKELGELIMRAGIAYKSTGKADAALEQKILSIVTTPPGTGAQFHYDDDTHLHIVVPNTENIDTTDLDSSAAGAQRLKAIASEALGSAVILGCQF